MNEISLHAEAIFAEFSDLTEQQKIIASAFALQPVFYPEKTLEDIAKEHGINRRTEQLWRQNPRYVDFKNRIGSIILSDYELTAHSRLIELIGSQNESTALKALSLFYTIQGKTSTHANGNRPSTFIHIEQSGKDDRIIIGEIEALREKLEQHKKQ